MTAFDAYEPPPPNELVRPIAFLSLMVVGAWNVCGWLMSDTPLALRVFLAAFTITFEILCFNVSAQKSRAEERETSRAVRLFWFWALIMCCGWSMFSAHNALTLFTPGMSDLQRAPAYIVLALAAGIVPLLPWAIERTERAPTKVEPKPTQPEPQLNPGPPTRPSAQRQRTSGKRPFVHEVGKAALAVGAATMPMGAHAADVTVHANNPAGDAWRAQARDLWVGGLRNKAEIARRVGRPRETVRRELAALGA